MLDAEPVHDAGAGHDAPVRGAATTGLPVRVEVLGPVRLLREVRPVEVGGPKQQAVLAVLALHARQPVPAERLAAAVWGDDPPASAATTLRAYVSRLRGHLPGGLLDRAGGGWRLDLPREAVDALRAEDLVTGAAEDPGPLEQALAMWRGEPLAGLGDLPLAAGCRARLGELRAAAQERVVALRLAAGHARDAAALAATLVEAHPHRESAVAQLAVALARSGRHADALAAVDALRHRLDDDLGLPLSPATADLHHRLLLHDPSLTGEPGRGRPAPAPPVPAAPVPPDGTVGTAAGPDGDPRTVAATTRGDTAPRLPVPLTSFVGREDDVVAVHDAMDHARLVTLVGPGGAGKTRLALEALRRRDDPDVDGPWLVELGWVGPGQVADAVAQVLGVLSTGAVGPAVLADAVRGRRLLLVLDNCEHVVAEAADLVEHLLAGCGGLQVLTTSREALGVPGERRCVVAPLGVGRPGRPGEAETLFAERARSAAPGFELDAATGTPVARLVRALDGIPLAVELAAARLSVMGLDDMLAMLDQRFALLEGGARTSLPHQRTLAAAVGWSHDLLDEQERRLFAVASTFAGPFELAALRGLAEPELDRPVISVLASLTAKSMVQVDGTTDLRASRTYRLLETLRAYGRAQTDPATAARLADRHAAWFAAEADEAFLGLRGPGTGRWLGHLDLVRPDMRAALAHAVARGDGPLAMRLVAGLSTYWFHRAHVQEGRSWLSAARALGGDVDETVLARTGLADALLAYAGGSAVGLDPSTLGALDTASASTADPSTAAVASVYAGYFQAAFGDLARAQAYFAHAGDLVGSGRAEPWAVAEVLFAQGQLLRAQGQPLPALQVLAESTRVGEACGHAWAQGSGRYIAAKVHIDLRQGAQALEALSHTLPLCLELGIATSTLACLHTAAAAVALLERHAEAAVLLGAVDAVGERLGYSPAAMDPVDAAAHRALVRQGLSDADFAAAYDQGRRVPLVTAVGRVLDLARATGRRAAPAG